MSSDVLSQDQRVRLARILGMLGSEFSGERLAAADAAHYLVVTADTTWEDVILTRLGAPDPPQQKKPPPHDPLDDWRTTVNQCLQHLNSLTEWEEIFLSGLHRFRRLSPKQRARLTEIAARVLRERAR